MSYRLPTFNLTCDAWQCGSTPLDGPPAYTSLPCQKYVSSRPQTDTTPAWQDDYDLEWVPAVILRFPRTVLPYDQVRVSWDAGMFECPPGSESYYRCSWQEIVHEGFPNEYAAVLVTQCMASGEAWRPPSRTLTTGIGEGPCG